MKQFVFESGKYLPVEKKIESVDLPAGVYEVKVNDKLGVFLEKFEIVHDELVHLPGSEYDLITSEMNHFLQKHTKAKFNELGFVYKRAALLYGKPGTGKTCIVNQVANSVVKKGGIVLFNPNPQWLSEIYTALLDSCKDRIKVVIFEELDKLVQKCEGTLLNLLDGEIQQYNIIYLATTNFLDKIPERIRRPGRFSSTIEVKLPNEQVRATYIKAKFPSIETKPLKKLIKLSEGLTIDDLKELVLATYCLEQPVKEVAKKLKKQVGVGLRKQDDDDDDDYSGSWGGYQTIEYKI